jgi:UDP-N-acetylmuramoyl-tripeptide--D-alanyl-D-alanine ligase
VRIESGTKVVAITGSAGKTTTKEVTAEFLAARYRVVRNRGNLNNHIGLPLSLMELTTRPEIAVVELGMSHAGEIGTLVSIAQPEIRVWTNVGEAHLGSFDSVEGIANAKAEILEGATAASVLVANADDERIVARATWFRGRVVTFGIERDADVSATAVVDRGIEGVHARVSTPRGDMDLATPLVGRANLANVLAATAVAVEFGIPLDAIAERPPAPARVAPRSDRAADQGVTVIDDSYNANPLAMRRALEVLRTAEGARGAWRCSARCSNWAMAPLRSTRKWAPRQPCVARRPAVDRRRRTCDGAWPTRPSPRACRAARVHHVDEPRGAVTAAT